MKGLLQTITVATRLLISGGGRCDQHMSVSGLGEGRGERGLWKIRVQD